MKTTINELHCKMKEKKEIHGDNRAGQSAVWQKVKAALWPPRSGRRQKEHLSGLVVAKQRGAGAQAGEQRCSWLRLAIRGLSRVPGLWLPAQLIPPGKKKKKDAGDSGTSYQGSFPAKKGLRCRNHSCDSWHHCQGLPVNIWAPALSVQVPYWRTDLSAE